MRTVWTLTLAASAVTLAAVPALDAMQPSPEPVDTYHCRAGFQDSWVYNEYPEGRITTIAARGRNAIRWNGFAVDRADLRRRLDGIGAERRPNFTMLNFTDETDCGLVQEVRQEMTRRLRCAEGRCGEHYTTDHPPPPPSAEEMNRRTAEALQDLDNALREMEKAAGPDPR